MKYGQKSSIGYTKISISKIYIRQKKYEEAKKLLFEALELHKQVKEPGAEFTPTVLLGIINTQQKKYVEAEAYLDKARKLAELSHSKRELSECYQAYAILDSAIGNFSKALTHYKVSIAYRDTFLNNNDMKAVTQQQMQYDFEKLQAADSMRFQQELEIGALKLGRQKTFTYMGYTGILLVGIFLFFVFRQRNFLAMEKRHSDELLLNILPSDIAEELKQKGKAEPKQFDLVSVMFTDFKGFTRSAERMSPAELVTEIDTCFREFDRIITLHNIEKIKTIGDSYMCAGGLPVVNNTNAIDVVSAALEINQFMEQHQQQRKREKKEPFEIRIGVHSGPIVAGIVGVKKFAYDIWGDTVNIASRMESSGEEGKVNISGSTYELVRDKFKCIHRGKIPAKGKGEIDMYFVEGLV